MRIASTTPWQYPRGVIRTTSMESSLRGVFRGPVEAGGSVAPWTPPGEQEPSVEQDPDRRADRELGNRGQAGWGDKCLERSRDDQQAGCAESEEHRSHRDAGQRFATTQLPRAKDRVAEHQPGTPADDDDAELEHAMRGDQRPELHVVATEANRRGNGAEHPAIAEQHNRGRDAEKHTAREADERDPNVVLNDECSGKRRILHAGADVALGHLVEE